MRVEIFDQTYHIQGEVDEAYMRELAQYVEGKLRAIAANSRAQDTQRIAVLAALNLADELFTARRRNEELERTVRQRAARALKSIEQVLQAQS